MSTDTNSQKIKHQNIFDTSQLIKYPNTKEKSSLIREIEIRPNEHCRIALGTFNSSNPPIGFTIHSKPRVDAAATTAKITSLVYRKSFKLFLHIGNSTDRILNVGVRQLYKDVR